MARSMKLRHALVAASSIALLTAGCSSDPATSSGPSDSSSPNEASNNGDTPDPVEVVVPQLTLSATGKKVKPDTMLDLQISNAEAGVKSVKVVGTRTGEIGDSEDKRVPLKGKLSLDGAAATWAASERLEPSSSYAVTVKLNDGTTLRDKFSTKKVSLSDQTYPTLFPSGEGMGVAQPIIVTFDVPISDKASIESALTVESSPKQVGSWHWMSDTEVRYRPKTYWKAGTRVKVTADTNSVPAGDGVFGQFDASSSFRIAKVSKIIKVDLKTQTLRAYENGKVVKSFPVSTGKLSNPDYVTRTGTKVVMSKERTHRMQSGSIGIDPNSGEGYDLVVDYAMRLTNTGEFFHAAPWNEYYIANGIPASHGCTGSRMADEAWLYDWADIGTPAEYTKGTRPMTPDNGWGDWNTKFKEYKKGSAL